MNSFRDRCWTLRPRVITLYAPEMTLHARQDALARGGCDLAGALLDVAGASFPSGLGDRHANAECCDEVMLSSSARNADNADSVRFASLSCDLLGFGSNF